MQGVAYPGALWAAADAAARLSSPLTLHEGDPNGTTALHQAVFQNHHDIVNLLIERGADPNIGDENVWTPLHWAVERRRMDMVKLLLNRGADPNKISKQWTPLHRAVQNGCKSTVQLLLNKGALHSGFG